MFTYCQNTFFLFCLISSQLTAMETAGLLPATSAQPSTIVSLAAQDGQTLSHNATDIGKWLTEKETLASKALPDTHYWASFSSRIAQPINQIAALFSVPAFVAAVNDQDPTSSFFINLAEDNLAETIKTLHARKKIATEIDNKELLARLESWYKVCSVTMFCIKNLVKNGPLYRWYKDREVLEALYQELEAYVPVADTKANERGSILVRALEERIARISELVESMPACATFEKSLETKCHYKPLGDMKKRFLALKQTY